MAPHREPPVQISANLEKFWANFYFLGKKQEIPPYNSRALIEEWFAFLDLASKLMTTGVRARSFEKIWAS